MRRRVALGGSIAIHLLAGIVLVLVRSGDQPISVEDSPTLEIAETSVDIDLVDLAEPPSGGGTVGSARSPSSVRPQRVARSEPTQVMRTTSTGRSLADSLSELADVSQDVDGDRGTGGGGRGGGHGHGLGRGVGPGIGELANAGEQRPVPPAAPKASKARPAKLIYPTRERSVEDGGELYLARVTVDTDGYVVGARLVRGTGPRDGDAAGQIFRFRYLPALDDDGRPIRSSFDQPFLVQ